MIVDGEGNNFRVKYEQLLEGYNGSQCDMVFINNVTTWKWVWYSFNIITSDGSYITTFNTNTQKSIHIVCVYKVHLYLIYTF